MFVLIWLVLLYFGRDTGASVTLTTFCDRNFCISLNDGELTAEAGLCVMIPCLVRTPSHFVRNAIIWYKCDPRGEKCDDSNIVFDSEKNNKNSRSELQGRVSLLDNSVLGQNCSIVINDLTVSDSGSYQLRVKSQNFLFKPHGFTFAPRTTVTVKDLTQKPTVVVPPLTKGQQATLTCTAPGQCSGSVPEITWMWRGPGQSDSYITENNTDFHSQRVSSSEEIHRSSLTFDASAAQHGTQVTCKVSFINNITTEETVTLNVTLAPRILQNSRCEINSRVLTCVCVSEGLPSPTITWPLLDLHTDYLVSSSVSQQTVSSSFTLPVSNYRSTVVECVSRNEAGEQRQNISVSISLRQGAVQHCKPHCAVLPWTIAAVSLILNAICIICLVLLWKARKAAKPNQESQTYMSLQRRDPSSEYDVIGQQVD